MDLSHLLKVCFYWLATIAGTGNVPIGFDGDVLDVRAGKTFLVKTWADNRQLRSITVSKDNAIRLIGLLVKSNLAISKDQKNEVILLQYNNATKEMSLIIENCRKEDGGIYNVEETVDDTSPNAFEREGGTWNFKLNVIETGEVNECSVGELFKIELRKLSTQRSLYYYDQIVVANLLLCDVAIHSHLHGRLRCSMDRNKDVIIIENVTQRDIGLYTVVNTNDGSNNVRKRYYLNVTDPTTNAIFGENVTIDWFYSQQAINRTLRIIHSHNGIMMTLQPNNEPQIVPAFQTRLVYSGDVSRCYMSFTLLNIEKSDSGLFKIETLKGNSISGCKHLIAQGGPLTANEVTELTPALTKCTTTDSRSTSGPSLVTLAEIMDAEEYTTSSSLTEQLTSPDNHSITYNDTNKGRKKNRQTFQRHNDKNKARKKNRQTFQRRVSTTVNKVTKSTPALAKDSSSTRGPYLVTSVEIVNTEEYTTSLSLTVRLTSPANDRNTSSLHVHVMYVVIGAMGLIIMMCGCLIWIQRNNRYSLKAVQELVLATSSSTLNSAPSAIRKQLPTAIVNEEELCRLIRSTPVGNAQSALKYRSNPDNSPSCDTQSTFAMSVPILEDDKPDCPTVCTSGSAASNTAVDLSQPDQCPYYPYARVKKGPRSTFTNNNQFAFSSVPDGELSDGYKMVNFTLGNELRNTFQNLEIVSESTIPVNVSLQEKDNTRNNYVRDLKNDDGYETCGNIKHMSCMEHVKVYEDEVAMTGNDQEPKNCIIPHGAMHSDYADIDI